MWRALPIIGVMWLGCSKCSPAEPSAPKAVRLPPTCTEAFAEVVPLALCEEKCSAGDAEACSVASDIHRLGLRTKRDKKLGQERAQRSCELGYSGGCSSLAASYLFNADGGEPDMTKFDEMEAIAIKHAERECTDGRARSCEALFFWYSRLERANDKEDPRTPEVGRRSLDLYREGCNRGDWYMCRRLALSHAVAGSGGYEELAAHNLYKKACNLGDAVSCKKAFPDDADDATSAQFLKRGCELGDGSSCFLWSLRLTGKQATDALALSCENGDTLGCEKLARSLKESGDAAGARRAQQSACEMGENIACPRD